MPTNIYITGEVVRLTNAITDTAGAAADPGVLRLKIKPPQGVLQSYVFGVDAIIVKDSAGSYHADLQLSLAGTWYWRWESDAPNPGAAESEATVAASKVL